MTPARKRRLLIVSAIILGVSGAIALLFFALGKNMNHYYELNEIAAGEAPINKAINIGGLVEIGSLKRQADTLKVTFNVTDLQHRIQVDYEGILPDLFREGQGVMAKGLLRNNKLFIADEILAKHDENYMAKEVKAELKKSGYYQHTKTTSTATSQTQE